MRWNIMLKWANNSTLEALKTSVKLKINEAPQYLQTVKEENKKIVHDKLVGLNKWYNKLIGLDEVNVYLERVAALQKELLVTQEKRREISRQLNDIRQKVNELQDKIQHVDRKENFNVYCGLLNEEREVMILERTTSNQFQEYDRTERDLFTAFTNAIRDSHEKQRAQVEYTKYLGFILSITGSFLAFFYTTYRKNDLKMFIDEKLATISLQFNAEPIIIRLNEQEALNLKVLKEVSSNRKSLSEIITYLSDEQANNNIVPQMITIKQEHAEVFKYMVYAGGILVLACITLRSCIG